VEGGREGSGKRKTGRKGGVERNEDGVVRGRGVVGRGGAREQGKLRTSNLRQLALRRGVNGKEPLKRGKDSQVDLSNIKQGNAGEIGICKRDVSNMIKAAPINL